MAWPRAAVWIGRGAVLALGPAALPIAWNPKSVFHTVFDARGVLAAGLGPAVILGLLTRRTNRYGPAVGILVALLVAQFWAHVKPVFGGDTYFASGLIPGFALNLLVACTLSAATNPRRPGAPAEQVPPKS